MCLDRRSNLRPDIVGEECAKIAGSKGYGVSRMPLPRFLLSKKGKERWDLARTEMNAAFNNFLSLTPSPWDAENQQERDRLLGRMIAIAKTTRIREDREKANEVVSWYERQGVLPDAHTINMGAHEWAHEWNARLRDQT
jgi:hypothetical protein